MRYGYFKGLTEHEAYNITDGLTIMLHEISLKRLGLDYNSLDTDISNEIVEKIAEAVDNLHEQLEESLEEYDSNKELQNAKE